MCIRDSFPDTSPAAQQVLIDLLRPLPAWRKLRMVADMNDTCLLYTSDAADDLLCVDLGGRRIIKKKKQSSKK